MPTTAEKMDRFMDLMRIARWQKGLWKEQAIALADAFEALLAANVFEFDGPTQLGGRPCGSLVEVRRAFAEQREVHARTKTVGDEITIHTAASLLDNRAHDFSVALVSWWPPETDWHKRAAECKDFAVTPPDA